MLIDFIITALPFIAVISLLFYMPFGAFTVKCFGKQSAWFHVVRYCLIGYFLSLIYLTVLWYFPDITFAPENRFLNLRPFVWIYEPYSMGVDRMAEQLILNVGMFIPLGILLPLSFNPMRKWRYVCPITLAVTLSIETLQYFIGRSADIDDVITNFIGGMIGYLIFILLNRKWLKSITLLKKT